MPQRSLISRSTLQHHYTIYPMWMFFSHSNVLNCRAQAELRKRQHLYTDYNVPLYNVYISCKARQFGNSSRGLMTKDHGFLHYKIANSAIDKIMNVRPTDSYASHFEKLITVEIRNKFNLQP
ncbi:hypothetical protein ALC56_04299 [Trachymyrmex septentrionalis]|uniref:Uncharacterized protein n=1 Tax=Trachymyrmex septentrionalis TaxID=34720 RepID=A0A195FL57_9HYME|nr:hypothetical protein ALC56_04299 [Trachymyrmex septentrionalis]